MLHILIYGAIQVLRNAMGGGVVYGSAQISGTTVHGPTVQRQ